MMCFRISLLIVAVFLLGSLILPTAPHLFGDTYVANVTLKGANSTICGILKVTKNGRYFNIKGHLRGLRANQIIGINIQEGEDKSSAAYSSSCPKTSKGTLTDFQVIRADCVGFANVRISFISHRLNADLLTNTFVVFRPINVNMSKEANFDSTIGIDPIACGYINLLPTCRETRTFENVVVNQLAQVDIFNNAGKEMGTMTFHFLNDKFNTKVSVSLNTLLPPGEYRIVMAKGRTSEYQFLCKSLNQTENVFVETTTYLVINFDEFQMLNEAMQFDLVCSDFCWDWEYWGIEKTLIAYVIKTEFKKNCYGYSSQIPARIRVEFKIDV